MQIKPGVPTDAVRLVGQYIVDRQPNVIVCAGDFWDMPSLSMYDRGKKSFEGRRYEADIEAGNEAIRLLQAPTKEYNRRRKPANQYKPRWVFLMGNHEDRISRAVEENAVLDGKVGLEDLELDDWEVHDFLEIVWIDGVAYSHYFYNPMTGRPYAGANIELRLKTIGHSFTMGHQQTLGYAIRFVGGRAQHGLVAGACYLHDEAYKGPQGNAHWRGVVVKHAVNNGAYNPMFVDLDYLFARYEGMTMDQFVQKKYRKPSTPDGIWVPR
jgi:hypothetical protein